MAILKLSAPQYIFYNKLNAFFKNDPEVNVVYDEDDSIIKIFVNNSTKATALSQILPTEKEFGNVLLRIEVIPANKFLSAPIADIYTAAFTGNPALSFVKTFRGLYNNPMTFVVFAKEVVQYFTDSLGDYFGQESTLYQNIAKDIFVECEGVYYCTDKD